MKRFVWMMITAALIVAGVLSYFASRHPDGLERVANRLGFEHQASETSPVPAVMPDYEVPGLESRPLSGGLAGVAGVLVVLAVCLIAGKALARKGARKSS